MLFLRPFKDKNLHIFCTQVSGLIKRILVLGPYISWKPTNPYTTAYCKVKEEKGLTDVDLEMMI